LHRYLPNITSEFLFCSTASVTASSFYFIIALAAEYVLQWTQFGASLPDPELLGRFGTLWARAPTLIPHLGPQTGEYNLNNIRRKNDHQILGSTEIGPSGI
jgi:hypothetical protein